MIAWSLRTLLMVSVLTFVGAVVDPPSAFAVKADKSGGLDTQHQQSLDQVLKKLYSDDAKESSSTAEQLASYPYREVQNVLLARVDSILSNPKIFAGYSYTVTAALKSLIEIADSTNLPEIRQLRELFEANLENPAVIKISRHVRDAFVLLEATATSRTSVAVTYRSAVPAGQIKTVSQLIQELPTTVQTQIDDMLMSGVEESIYDRSVEEMNSAHGFTKYYGRDDELEKLAQALLRREKAHAILTGKAGVGKTTVLSMLSNAWFQKTMSHPGLEIPIMLELTITDVTNPTDPSTIKKRLAGAKLLAEHLKRDVVLFIDEAHISSPMTRNAIKNFLTRKFDDRNRVHFVWATTSSESRSFLADSAFSRRWVEVNVPEFTNEESIALVKSTYVDVWKRFHVKDDFAFDSITEDAYEFAAKYARFEQPHAGNPTGIKELLEGTIVYKKRELERKVRAGEKVAFAERKFTITTDDLRKYLTFHLGMKLVPGDPEFEQKFDAIWKLVENDYVGNEGLMKSTREWVHAFFTSLTHEQMVARMQFGPPGGGKSFLPKLIAKYFFNTEPLVVNMAEYSTGDLSVNKFIGSPTGTVGSEQQRSIFTKYIKDNPRGGVVTLEEADLGHKDLLNLLVNMFTDKVFVDGLGQSFNVERYIFILNSNIGQEVMIAKESNGKPLTWENIEMRRRAITTEVVIDGNSVAVVRPEITMGAFDRFLAKLSLKSSPNADTSIAIEEGEKLKRRIGADYVLPPSLEDLRRAGLNAAHRFILNKKKEHDVEIQISDADIEKILDLEHFRFEEGYGYINRQLETRFSNHVTKYLSGRGTVLKITLGTEEVKVGKKTINGLKLKFEQDGVLSEQSLGISIPASSNPWFASKDMMMRLAAYPQEMAKRVQGQDRQNAKLASMLRAKAFNWSHQIVFTQIGTSGNGKTEYAFSMAEVLFGSRDAAFKIPGLTNWGDLNNYLRSDTGFSGHREVTDFERWFMARKTLGGGVIILDELLSFSGLKAEEISAKVGVINKLYDLLDEGVLKFGNRKEDARGFVVAITGNSMQELFDAIDDSPESEKLVQRILARIDGNDITKYFARIGIDAPKVARFGPIFVNGPLPRAVSERVGQKEVRNAIARATEEIRQIYDVEVIIDPKIIGEIVSTVTTVRLGMRDVNQAIKTLIIGPVSGIFFNLVGSEKIEATWLDGKIVWTVDGQRVVSTVTGAADAIDHVWSVEKDLESNAVVSTPQMKDVTHPPKIIMTPAERLRVAHHEVLGHFMTAYLLSGKNNTETISLVPTDGMLGMVRLKESRFEYDGESLTSWLKEMAVLESGHRAVFISGYYSAGGGSGERRDPRKPAMDDLGRVQSVLDTMLSNQIFNHFTEFSSSADRDLFKKFMMHVTKGIADRIIRYGIKSRAFEELFNETYASKFIAAERIELLIAQADTSKLLKPDELLSRATASASAQALIKMRASHIVSERDLKRVGDLARELVTKVNRELGMGEAGRRLGVSKVKPSVNTCESIFKAAF